MSVADYDGSSGQPAWRGEAEPSAIPPPPPPIIDELRLLIGAARQMASAELAYQSARARLMGKAAVLIAAGAGLALALLFFVLMALVMGLLLALGPLLGPWGAMGAVVGGLVLAVVIAALVAFIGVRRFMALINDGKDRP